MVPELNNSERYSHLIHSYPAKLLSNIPYFFLQTNYFCPQDGIVLDPFCGTGTVMLEANISGRNALGADANPLAVLISKVKTTYIPSDVLHATLNSIVTSARRSKKEITFETDNIKRWFSSSTILQLTRLEDVIGRIGNKEQKRFFMLCFSNMIKKVSFADPNISVPVKLNPERFINNPDRKQSIDKSGKTKSGRVEKRNVIFQAKTKRIKKMRGNTVNVVPRLLFTRSGQTAPLLPLPAACASSRCYSRRYAHCPG